MRETLILVSSSIILVTCVRSNYIQLLELRVVLRERTPSPTTPPFILRELLPELIQLAPPQR
eukprot:4445181-Amphidinium_carterae.1